MSELARPTRPVFLVVTTLVAPLFLSQLGCAPDGLRPCRSSAQCEAGEECLLDNDGDVGTCIAAAVLDDGGVPLDDGGTDGGDRADGGSDGGPIDGGSDGGPIDGDGGPDDTDAGPDAGPPPMAANDVTVGGGFACARTYGNDAFCWGYNSSGQLGNDDDTINVIHPPTKVTGLSDVRALAAAEDHACAIGRAFGQEGIWCWGSSADGELGTAAGQPVGVPRRVAVDDEVHEAAVDLQTGARSTCVRTSDGEVWCWGPGVPGYTPGNPVEVTVFDGAVRLHVSDGAICAKLGTGVVRCLDQPGVVRSLCTSIAGARECGGLLNAERFRFSATTACRIDGGDTVGALYCAGENEFGVVYPSDPADMALDFTPLEEWLDYSIKQVSLGDQHACALGYDSIVRCWGRNLWSSTGHPEGFGDSCSTDADCHEPTVVPGLPDVTDIDTFRFYTCAVAHDGAIWCWGALSSEGSLPARYVIPD